MLQIGIKNKTEEQEINESHFKLYDFDQVLICRQRHARMKESDFESELFRLQTASRLK
jgi:hypothetical protein